MRVCYQKLTNIDGIEWINHSSALQAWAEKFKCGEFVYVVLIYAGLRIWSRLPWCRNRVYSGSR